MHIPVKVREIQFYFPKRHWYLFENESSNKLEDSYNRHLFTITYEDNTILYLSCRLYTYTSHRCMKYTTSTSLHH